MSAYKVLQRIGAPRADSQTAIEPSWRELGTVEASDANAAIKQLVDKGEGTAGAGSYVAVPARSWKPVKAQVSTVRKVELS